MGLAEVDAETKNKVLELVSVLASEATVPKENRRGTAMRTILAEWSSICSEVAALAPLYAQYAPAIIALFQ